MASLGGSDGYRWVSTSKLVTFHAYSMLWKAGEESGRWKEYRSYSALLYYIAHSKLSSRRSIRKPELPRYLLHNLLRSFLQRLDQLLLLISIAHLTPFLNLQKPAFPRHRDPTWSPEILVS
ncbi:hypothetical protein K504DRAFT_212395 [Pleomassaria siparia CBS 279.74]|uniref:Uncharacterized protein n=1 Tax=Pleomassaria siparia CBS 279.74 TaxID=1314801 RepID=A0A6G1KIY6_9PLEO|nr:hypothetical protein K504DRAFT_212395 [Pleomassaria siparia CBS 279.74]